MDGAIQDSVGRRGRNHRHDVLVVQMLLNNHLFAIGPRPKLSVDGVCGPMTAGAIAAYQQRALRMTHPDGVIYPGGRTLGTLLAVASVKHRDVVREVHQVQKLQSAKMGPVANVMQVAPRPKSEEAAASNPKTAAATKTTVRHKYTDNALEMVQAATVVSPLSLPDLVQKGWTGLNADGARLITAQYMGETTGGKHCWNYNLGNVKCGKSQRNTHLHQYFPGTWEYYSTDVAASEVKFNQNARYATAAEIKAKVGKEAKGKKVVFYKPPDIECCFLAYKSLADGVLEWINRFKDMAIKDPKLLDELNKSDYAAFAGVLKKHHYFTNDQTAYANSMKRQKEYLDKALGKK